ncbi:protein kinase domain-containing protein [Mesorhizobium amorphae]|nr:protein kinase [Mesorhizobium amorphae]ANT53064.1 hypothetical protein A6B35_25930 [Mesorhizobium amorphae CCNWGS0123]GLR40944.1 hypothetical protein GCM10007880_14600 [Mesorhizobium amorphae]
MVTSTAGFPDPGPQYRIKERIGGGAWKTAYRASQVGALEDVALLYFHDDNMVGELIKEFSKLLVLQKKPDSTYIAELKGYNKGKDGKHYLIEELIRRPLEVYSPLQDIATFTKVARDLCRGLKCIHGERMVHRDLKLDNCGVDSQGRAKIFDLGSLTSEPGEIKATILTRAPELFGNQKKESFKRRSDVWALGATLFALRTGEYPFVYTNEIESRRKINKQYALAEADRKDLDTQKRKIDDEITERISGSGAEATLLEKIHKQFRGKAEELIKGMLTFDVKRRLALDTVASGWSALASELDGARNEQRQPAVSKLERIRKLLDACIAREIALTATQIDRVYSEFTANFDGDAALVAEFEGKFIRAKNV